MNFISSNFKNWQKIEKTGQKKLSDNRERKKRAGTYNSYVENWEKNLWKNCEKSGKFFQSWEKRENKMPKNGFNRKVGNSREKNSSKKMMKNLAK